MMTVMAMTMSMMIGYYDAFWCIIMDDDDDYDDDDDDDGDDDDDPQGADAELADDTIEGEEREGGGIYNDFLSMKTHAVGVADRTAFRGISVSPVTDRFPRTEGLFFHRH